MSVSDGSWPQILGSNAGTETSGHIPGPRLVDGGRAAIPFFSLRGRFDGATVVVTAGSHGDELNAVRAAAALRGAISTQELSGNLVVLPALNPIAFRDRSRLSVLSPTDLSNLHDSFPGRATGDSVSRMTAAIVEAVAVRISPDLIIDLHTGALGNYCRPHCFYAATGKDEVVRGAAEAARAFDTGVVIRAGTDLPAYATSSMIHAWAHERGIAAIGVELGTAIPSESQQVSTGVGGIRNVLAALGMLPAETAAPMSQLIIDKVVDVRAPFGGLCELHVSAGHDVAAAAPLATISTVFGEKLGDVATPVAGHLIGVTSLGALNEGERIARIGIVSSESRAS